MSLVEASSSQPQGCQDEALEVTLLIEDPQIVRYLSRFSQDRRNEKALEALKVGVLALESASPTLDARIVEERFRSTEAAIDSYLGEFQRQASETLKTYFDKRGQLPVTLDSFLGEKGTLSSLFTTYFDSDSGRLPRVFNDYFSKDSGKLSRLIESHIGPQSDFCKKLDPKNKDSILTKLEETVRTNLEMSMKSLLDQFSLDEDSSALTRLQKTLSQEIEKLKESNAKAFTEISEGLGIRKAKAQEAELGTQKGRDLEEVAAEHLERVCAPLEDCVRRVGNIPGKKKNCKTGDLIIELGPQSSAEGKKIVIEVKGTKGYHLGKAENELKEAKENREAVVGIFAFEKGSEPSTVGDFLMKGLDFFVTIDRDALDEKQPVPYLEAAYRIGRVLIAGLEREKANSGFDKVLFEGKVNEILKSVAELSKMDTMVGQINTSAKTLKEGIADFRKKMEGELQMLINLLKTGEKEESTEVGVTE